MIKGEKEYLDGIAKNYVCKDDGGHLVTAWHAKENSYVIACQHDHYPEEVIRQLSLTEQYRAGEELPEPIKSNIQKGITKRRQMQTPAAVAETFTGVPATDLGTGELIPRDMIHALCVYARKYGLDPSRGHVCLMYGQPYITIDGYLYHANQEGEPYTLSSRPLNKEEFPLFQIPDGAHAWLATATLTKDNSYTTGIGIVTREEMTAKSKRHPDQLAAPVVARHPWQLAQKRAEWQALRRRFPIGESPQGEEE